MQRRLFAVGAVYLAFGCVAGCGQEYAGLQGHDLDVNDPVNQQALQFLHQALNHPCHPGEGGGFDPNGWPRSDDPNGSGDPNSQGPGSQDPNECRRFPWPPHDPNSAPWDPNHPGDPNGQHPGGGGGEGDGGGGGGGHHGPGDPNGGQGPGFPGDPNGGQGSGFPGDPNGDGSGFPGDPNGDGHGGPRVPGEPNHGLTSACLDMGNELAAMARSVATASGYEQSHERSQLMASPEWTAYAVQVQRAMSAGCLNR